MMKLFLLLSFSFPILKSRKQSERTNITFQREREWEKFANFLLSISQLVIEKNELKSQIAQEKFFALNSRLRCRKREGLFPAPQEIVNQVKQNNDQGES
jgi:hypothetical protein